MCRKDVSQMDTNEIKTTKLRLLPVCECGYVFREIKINRKMMTIDNFSVPVESRFEPPICPNCKKFIREIHTPQDFSM